MKTRVVIMAGAVAFSSAAWAAEPVRQTGAHAVVSASYAARDGGTVNIIVRPDGGGLEADPDIGMPAMNPSGPDTPVLRR